jgi:hypothetical protein
MMPTRLMPDPAVPASPPAASGRQLVLVVGVGRSGTSLASGILGQLGLHIPQPEVTADETNPRGFGEPLWVVDFHTRLLEQRYISVNDARPHALEITGRDAPVAEEQLRDWLTEQFAVAEALVVKDPRTIWFLPLWIRVAEQLGATTSFVTMLRHPAEIVTSARKYYGTRLSSAARAGAWIHLILHTEQATRGARRAFVRYEDLLADWESEVRRIGKQLGSPLLADVDRTRHPAVDGFVDPTLHRNRVGWESLEVPARVREMADDVWEQLQVLAQEGGDTEAVWPVLDGRHAAYQEMYAEAEALAQSSVLAAKRREAAIAAAKAPPSLRVRVARRIPRRYRQQIRKALGAARPE